MKYRILEIKSPAFPEVTHVVVLHILPDFFLFQQKYTCYSSGNEGMAVSTCILMCACMCIYTCIYPIRQCVYIHTFLKQNGILVI